MVQWGAIGGGAGATGGGTDEVFFENDQTATTSYSITANKHAHTVSPTINSGVTITVPSGAILSYLIVMALKLTDQVFQLTGISVGGLPDGIVDTDMLAADTVTI